jgi:hypothetical protein
VSTDDDRRDREERVAVDVAAIEEVVRVPKEGAAATWRVGAVVMPTGRARGVRTRGLASDGRRMTTVGDK